MTSSPDRRITVCATVDELAQVVARTVVDAATASVKSRGRFTLVLSGGETPRAAFELLARAHPEEIAWDRTDVFFSDERLVPPGDPRSNYRMARETLLSRVPVRAERVHAIPTNGGAPDELASRYESTLHSHLASYARANSPTFDLALLGVGADGHTASLFPGDPALGEGKRWVLAVEAPASAQVRDRITLTLPVLNRTRHVVFLVAGESKREAVARALRGSAAGGAPLPASLVRGIEATDWLVDAAAVPDTPPATLDPHA